MGGTAAKPSFPYSTTYLVEVENTIIVDVEATTAIPQAEVPCQSRTRAGQRLGSISKQVDRYLRSLVMAGALAAIFVRRQMKSTTA